MHAFKSAEGETATRNEEERQVVQSSGVEDLLARSFGDQPLADGAAVLLGQLGRLHTQDAKSNPPWWRTLMNIAQ